MRPKVGWLLLVVAACALLTFAGLFALFIFFSPTGHFAVEFFSVVVGVAVAYLSLRTFSKTGSSRVLIVGSAFFLMAALDFLHSLSFADMPQTLLPVGTNIQLQFWITSRVLGGLLLLAAVALPDRGILSRRRFSLAAAFFGVSLLFAAALSAVIWLFPKALPVYFVEGSGLTPLKIAFEYIAMGAYAAAAIFLLRGYRRTRSELTYWFALGLVVLVFSELCFTLYRNPWEFIVWLGHSFKIAAFAAFLIGLRQTAKR